MPSTGQSIQTSESKQPLYDVLDKSYPAWLNGNIPLANHVAAADVEFHGELENVGNRRTQAGPHAPISFRRSKYKRRYILWLIEHI